MSETEQLIYEILDYLEDREAIDFEDQCNEKGLPPQELLWNDEHDLSSHIYNKACRLRYLLNNRGKRAVADDIPF